MAIPAPLRPIRTPAINSNENRIPAEDAKNPTRTARCAEPPWLTTFSSLIDRTGSTQGIKLRIRPPITARTIIVSSDWESTVPPKPIDGTVPSPTRTDTTCSIARPLSTSVRRRGAVSNSLWGTPPAVSVRTALRASDASDTFGRLKKAPSGPST